MREHHEEEEQQQLQHTYLSKNLSNNRFASKISSIKQNKTKNRKKRRIRSISNLLSKGSVLNIKQEEYEEQRATTTRTKITKRKHLNSKLYNTLHYKKKKKWKQRKKHDNEFCKLIQNTFSEADLLKCTTKNANTQIKNSKQNKTLF